MPSTSWRGDDSSRGHGHRRPDGDALDPLERYAALQTPDTHPLCRPDRPLPDHDRSADPQPGPLPVPLLGRGETPGDIRGSGWGYGSGVLRAAAGEEGLTGERRAASGERGT